MDIYFGSDADVSLAGLLGLLEHRDVSHVATLGSDAFFSLRNCTSLKIAHGTMYLRT